MKVQNLIFFVLILFTFSCKKFQEKQIDLFQFPTSIKLVTSIYPILKFENTQILKNYLQHLKNNEVSENFKLKERDAGFISLRDVLDNFSSSKNKGSQPILTVLGTDDNNIQSDTTEYLMNRYKETLEDDILQEVVNPDLQIIVGNKLYQLTHDLGTFEININNINNFETFISKYKNEILFNPNFKTIPNEIKVNDSIYNISEGINRLIEVSPEQTSNLINQNIESINKSQFDYSNYEKLATVGTDFKRVITLPVEGSSNRRFVLEAYNTNFLKLNIWRSIGVKAQLQRERKFLFFKWWGESFANELIVGCDNMNLTTSDLFQGPQTINKLPRPKFNGLINVKLGNHSADFLNVQINTSVNFLGFSYQINNQNLINLTSDKLNDVVNDKFNNYFSAISNDIINSFDPWFKQRYNDYSLQLENLNAQNKLRFVFGKTEKKQGYSESNNWKFDWNTGIEIKINGSGTTVSPKTYSYEMKAGSFFGKAYVDGKWYLLRIVVIS